MAVDGDAPVRTQRKRRGGRALLVLLLILIVLVVAADRMGAAVAERQIATQAQSQLASEEITTTGRPDVSIQGFPFLTQVASGHYDRIDITVRNPTSRGIRLDDVKVIATSVDAPASGLMSGDPKVTAGKVTGTAHINWTAFQQMIDLTGAQKYGLDPDTIRITSTTGGKIQLTTPVTLLGQTITAAATGSVQVNRDTLHVTIDSIKATGDALAPTVDQALNQLKTNLSFNVKIPPMPYDLHVDSINSSEAGVVVSASAENVALAK
jgi:DUF2993 family protein